MNSIDQSKLKDITLEHGEHASPEVGMCLLEAASYLAGEPFSDSPKCVCPTIAAFGRRVNDQMTTYDRQKLKALLPDMIGTRGSEALEQRRAFRFADFAVRVAAPASLEKKGLAAEADKLRALAPITDRATALVGSNAACGAAAAAAYYASYPADPSFPSPYVAYYASYPAAVLPAETIVDFLREVCAMKEEV